MSPFLLRLFKLQVTLKFECYRLIQATPENEDPVALLQAAAREHIPLDPSNKASLAALSTSQHAPKPIPDPEHRPSIEAVIEELRGKDWYMGQILYERTAEAKEARIGSLPSRRSCQ